jgi:hypothetical protein
MVIEKANLPAAVLKFKEALMAGKTIELDPRLTDDVIEICTRQLTQMTNEKTDNQICGILRNKIDTSK